ncbi:integral membrane protein, putative [Rhodobacteraceae bacterium HTCC2083]|nr:integral membrane protein, putative [Rhodobacteraceae bacterium HTCC2083]
MFGFAGVVVLAWPELSLDATDRARLLGYAISISGAALSALALLVVRRLNKTERPGAIAFYFVLVSMIGGLMTITFGWIWPDMTTLLFLVTAGDLRARGALDLDLPECLVRQLEDQINFGTYR